MRRRLPLIAWLVCLRLPGAAGAGPTLSIPYWDSYETPVKWQRDRFAWTGPCPLWLDNWPGHLGAFPVGGSGSFIYRLRMPHGVTRVRITDRHTAWSPRDETVLSVSSDGEAWRVIYDETPAYSHHPFSQTIDVVPGGHLYVRYSFSQVGPGRPPDDNRGSMLWEFRILIAEASVAGMEFPVVREAGRLRPRDAAAAWTNDPHLAAGNEFLLRGEFRAAIGELEQVEAEDAVFIRTCLLAWVAGDLRFDAPGDIELLKQLEERLGTVLKADSDHLGANVLCPMAAGMREALEEVYAFAQREGPTFVLGQMQKGGPFYAKACLNAGRTLYWIAREGGKREYYSKAEGLFKEAAAEYPDHRLVKMYLGEKIPWTSTYTEGIDGAPQWAVLQREALARVLEVCEYWVTRRQRDDGQFGGGWGDDVEMLRWWTPAVLASADPVAARGLRRLVDGVWERSGILEDGYCRRMSDVEHSAEPTSDTLPSMVAIEYGNPEYVERCMLAMRPMRDVWTARNRKDRLHFRSVQVSSTAVSEDPKWAFDVPYCARAAKPGLWVAWYNRHPALMRLFEAWAKAWVEDSRETENGKPAGVIPPSVRFPDGVTGVGKEGWWKPDLYWSYFTFPGGCQLLVEQLLGTWALTGDASFMEPVAHALGLAARHWRGEWDAVGPPGSESWVAAKCTVFRDGFAKWRLLGGDSRFDDVLAQHGPGYLRWVLTGDKAHLTEDCRRSIASTKFNFEMLTSEVRFTDRVSVRGTNHLYAMYTGGTGIPGYYPTLRVTWLNTGKHFAALVLPRQRDGLRLLAYNFEATTRSVGMRLWDLAPGTYELRTGPDDDRDDVPDRVELRRQVTLAERGQAVELQLPPRRLQSVEMRPVELLPDSGFSLPDPAMSDRDVKVTSDGAGLHVNVRVHNIGCRDARGVTVRLFPIVGGTQQDTCLAQQTIPLIPAPLDLRPSVRQASLAASLPEGVNAVGIRLGFEDPKQRELCLANNRLTASVP